MRTMKMKTNIYSVYDSKAKSYFQPTFSTNHETMIRAIKDLVIQQGHQFCEHAEDFILFYLGTYDDSNAKIDLVEAESISRLLDIKMSTVE